MIEYYDQAQLVCCSASDYNLSAIELDNGTTPALVATWGGGEVRQLCYFFLIFLFFVIANGKTCCDVLFKENVSDIGYPAASDFCPNHLSNLILTFRQL